MDVLVRFLNCHSAVMSAYDNKLAKPLARSVRIVTERLSTSLVANIYSLDLALVTPVYTSSRVNIGLKSGGSTIKVSANSEPCDLWIVMA